MKTSKLIAVMLILAIFTGTMFAGGQKDAPKQDGSVAGSIVVLTHRTDWVDTKFQDYLKAFNVKYPNVSVEFEAITDFNGTVRTRMGTKEYGDALNMVTVPPTPAEFVNFYEPL